LLFAAFWHSSRASPLSWSQRLFEPLSSSALKAITVAPLGKLELLLRCIWMELATVARLSAVFTVCKAASLSALVAKVAVNATSTVYAMSRR
jgi:hypothetical protein